MEPETPPQNPLSVSAAQTPQPSAGNRKTNGAFGKAKAMKRMSDYFPAPFRKAKHQHTFAANAVPPEPDALAEHIAAEQGWKRKANWNGIDETTTDPLESDDDAPHQPSELEEGEDGFRMP